jgi:uncharacterized OB-fold protein
MGPLPESWTLPRVDDVNRDWFESAAVRVQACGLCDTRQHPPEEICHRCGSMELGTIELGPRGTVHSYTVVHYPVNAALAESVPYAVVLVELDDDPGIRVVGNILGCDPGEVRIGLSVEATWEARSDAEGTVHLLQWRAAGPGLRPAAGG